MINVYRTVIVKEENDKQVLFQEPLYTTMSKEKDVEGRIKEIKQLVKEAAEIQFTKPYVIEVSAKSYFIIDDVTGMLSFRLNKDACNC